MKLFKIYLRLFLISFSVFFVSCKTKRKEVGNNSSYDSEYDMVKSRENREKEDPELKKVNNGSYVDEGKAAGVFVSGKDEDEKREKERKEREKRENEKDEAAIEEEKRQEKARKEEEKKQEKFRKEEEKRKEEAVEEEKKQEKFRKEEEKRKEEAVEEEKRQEKFRKEEEKRKEEAVEEEKRQEKFRKEEEKRKEEAEKEERKKKEEEVERIKKNEAERREKEEINKIQYKFQDLLGIIKENKDYITYRKLEFYNPENFKIELEKIKTLLSVNKDDTLDVSKKKNEYFEELIKEIPGSLAKMAAGRKKILEDIKDIVGNVKKGIKDNCTKLIDGEKGDPEKYTPEIEDLVKKTSKESLKKSLSSFLKGSDIFKSRDIFREYFYDSENSDNNIETISKLLEKVVKGDVEIKIEIEGRAEAKFNQFFDEEEVAGEARYNFDYIYEIKEKLDTKCDELVKKCNSFLDEGNKIGGFIL